jgi:hypothetical protein
LGPVRECPQVATPCLCWPAVMHFALWPYALCNAALLHNSLPVLEDGTSRLELPSSIQVGCNMKHAHTFACPVFVLQNELALGKLLPRWSPRARLGLNLGPSPTHARNVYLVLILLTGCVSPQYHCWFDDFFEMTDHSGLDVSDTICWQQLAGIICVAQILSNLAWPTQSNLVSQAIPLENRPNTLDDFSVSQEDFDVMLDGKSFADGESQATGSSGNSCTSQASHQAEGVTTIEPPVTASTSRSKRVHTFCHREWPNPHHSGTSTVHQVCITWPTSQLQPSTRQHLRTYFTTTITLTYKNICKIRLHSMLR